MVEIVVAEEVSEKAWLDVGVELQDVVFHGGGAEVTEADLVEEDGRKGLAREGPRIVQVGDDEDEEAVAWVLRQVGRGERPGVGKIVRGNDGAASKAQARAAPRVGVMAFSVTLPGRSAGGTLPVLLRSKSSGQGT